LLQKGEGKELVGFVCACQVCFDFPGFGFDPRFFIRIRGAGKDGKAAATGAAVRAIIFFGGGHRLRH